MRIPIPVAAILCLLALAIPVWLGMRNADFLTPPEDAALDAIRSHAESALPRLSTQSDAISAGGTGTRMVAEAPPVHLGNLSAPPLLTEYADRAVRGAPYLIELANRLENEGHLARALLAWERVVDRAVASESETNAAIAAMARLNPGNPSWNGNTGERLAIVIHAGTGKKSAEALEPILRQAAAEIARASSGILTVASKVNSGPDIDIGDGPVPVAIWMSGTHDQAPSTEVLSFTVATPETLEHDTHRTLYLLIQGHLRNSPEIKRPPDPPEEGDPREALNTQITRLQWKKFGELLNSL
ncbi:MAG: hypothetical protein ACNA8L_01975 [Luteolibacter sp.]